ncbi:MAG: GNAT family N-acetyltransferase [Actinomycetota bacterium]|nr:GNAT family N-acetyltransferase [Actinomycetota bacterium]
MTNVRLREVEQTDLPTLFRQQLDAEANRMAAFTVANPEDREAFDARWQRILANEELTVRTIVVDDEVAGSVSKWRDPDLPGPEVSYWLGRDFWGKGVATLALAGFVEVVTERPLYGRCAADNVGSRRVLEKCGFVFVSEHKGFSNARGEEIAEVLLELR